MKMQAKLIKLPPEMIEDIKWLDQMVSDIGGEKPNFSATLRMLLRVALRGELAKTERGAKYRIK